MKYQNVLRQAYEDRVFTNPRYSMRSFARDLGIAPSTLSEVLSGKKGISPKKAVAFVMEIIRFYAFVVKIAISLALMGELKACTREMMSNSKYTRMFTRRAEPGAGQKLRDSERGRRERPRQ